MRGIWYSQSPVVPCSLGCSEISSTTAAPVAKYKSITVSSKGVIIDSKQPYRYSPHGDVVAALLLSIIDKVKQHIETLTSLPVIEFSRAIGAFAAKFKLILDIFDPPGDYIMYFIKPSLVYTHSDNFALATVVCNIQLELPTGMTGFTESQSYHYMTLLPKFKLKAVCPGDEVETAVGKMEVISTGLFGVNTPWWPCKDTLKPWMTRRMLMLDMSVNAFDLPKADASCTEFSRMHFVHTFLYYCLTTPKLPITPNNLMNTIFAAKSHIATRASEPPFNTIILLAKNICTEVVLGDTENTDDCAVEAKGGFKYSELVYNWGFYMSPPSADAMLTVEKKRTVGAPRHLGSTDTPIHTQLWDHSSEPVKLPSSTVLFMIGEQHRTPELPRSNNCGTMTSPLRDFMKHIICWNKISEYPQNQSMQPKFGYQMVAPDPSTSTYQVPADTSAGSKLFPHSSETLNVKFTMDAVVQARYIKASVMQLKEPENTQYANQPLTTQFLSTIQLGTSYSDASYIEHLLSGKLILEYRKNVGKRDKNQNSRILRDGSSGHGIRHLLVGIPAKLVENIILFLRNVYKFQVTTESSTAMYGGVQLKNLMGDSHLNLKLMHSLNESTNNGPPHISVVKSADSSGNVGGASASTSKGQAPWPSCAFSVTQAQQSPVIPSRNYRVVLARLASPAASLMTFTPAPTTIAVPLGASTDAPAPTLIQYRTLVINADM
ncbi:hypothetical protein BDK51DRAFT_39689 [Blyttiomyces helicus]|uniref:Uncharacterized protein n=1 Tax=Blyttiomyces helicus TaxID=388810 RepID=A0A4P9WND9_9FUNG|nr:hypothetical protein BDK51DRAFT_39689 [Blyttiomyces helicus]|eukprot:RKO94641.1 hypothetical protein BDK51DRAFT_39689 [Blyttiomyces helicus]